MPPVKLIVTDLDGTLIGAKDEYDIYTPFQIKLRNLKSRHNTIWVINTGRGIGNFKRVFHPLQSLGIQPDYVIVNHAYAFSVTKWFFRPHWLWNMQMRFLIMKNRILSGRMIRQCQKLVRDRFRRVRTLQLNNDAVRLSFRDNDSMESAFYLLKVMSESNKNLMVFQHLTDIIVRSVPFTKGLAVRYLAKHLEVPFDNILTIGDGLNDLSMLDPSVAAMTACPSNSIAEVIEKVHKNGGHISRQPTLAGTLEAISAFDSDMPRSDLPENWDEVKQARQARRDNSDRMFHSHQATRRIAMDILLFLTIVLIVLLALASVGMLGPFSKPLVWPIEQIAKLFGSMFAF